VLRNPVYLLFGHGGLLGTAVFSELCEISPADYRIFSFDRTNVNIRDYDTVKSVVSYVRPTVVINCAAMSSPDVCEKAKEEAYMVNGMALKGLSELCHKYEAKLVHFSSAYVYDGKRKSPYTERCRHRPVGVIGKSKAAGEVFIRKACPDHLILRPGWVFAPYGPNFLVDWIENADRGLPLYVPPGKTGSPTFVQDLVRAAMILMGKDATGTFHVSNSGQTTLDDMAATVVSMTRSGSEVVSAQKKSATLDPILEYSTLSCRKYSSLTGDHIRSWDSALKACLFQMGRFYPDACHS
jgi:dTDP-4-dehydrorhamnose reductase